MSNGKNFSCNNLGQRKKSDFYETPYSITKQLLDTELFDKKKIILEPACGNGAISKVIRYMGFDCVEYDVEKDFFTENGNYNYVITNPPFSLANRFILKAKEVCSEKFCFLLPLSYLHGKERFDSIYKDKDFPLSTVYVFTRYPMLGNDLREDGKYKTGMMVYAWYVWDKNYQGVGPIIKWIDNNSYVIGSSSEVFL